MKTGGTNELVIRNKTKDTLGFLYNTGNGVTQFRRIKQLNDTTFVMGGDTVLIKSSASGGSGLNTLNGLNAGIQTFANSFTGTAPSWTSATSTHTLNIPMASAVGVTAGLVTKTSYDTWQAKIGPADTAVMLQYYMNFGDTVSLSNRINQVKATGITAIIADITTSAPDPFGVAIAQLSNTGVVPGTYTNSTVTVDSKGRILTIANGSGGGVGSTDNVNGGAGYRLVIAGQVVRTIFSDGSILMDTTSNVNGLTLKVDSADFVTPTALAAAVASGGSAITALTGDVTATGPGSAAATIANDAVTFAKFQNLTANRLLGRYTASTGDMQYITLGTGFTLNTSTGVLDFTGGGTTYTFTAPLSETGGVVSIANAAADASTKGAASFETNHFNSSAGNISIDFTNGPSASAGVKGYLTAADWSTFNGKISNITGLVTAGDNITLTGLGTAGSPYVINAAGSGTGTVNTGFANTLAYYPSTGTVVDDLAAITASRALVSNANGLPVAATTTATEIGYVNGVTSSIQNQLNNKQSTITLGTTGQYFRGDLSLATFSTLVSSFTNDAAYLTNITGKVTAGTNISISGSGTAGSPYVVSSTATGLADGDKGDITVSASGATWNIDALAVTNAEINDVAWGKITSVPTDIVYLATTQTLTNKTLTSPVINVTADATGDVYYRSAGGAFTRLGIGSTGQVLKVVSGIPAWAADLTDPGGGATLTDGDYGDVTVSGTGSAINVDAGAITNAKLANVATNIFKGRITAGTGAVEDLTVTQATSMLNVFSSSLKGLAPASGGGTTTFLRADGTWAAPASGYSFESNDFDGTTTISIDYVNAQKATTSLPGFLTAANWNTFNNKQNAITTGTTAQYFRGDLSLATFPTVVSSFTNDAGYLTNITGKVTAGTNVTITGAGTTGSPYVVNAAAGTTYSNGYGLNLVGTVFSVDTATIFSPYLTAINARIKYSDSSTMLTAYRNALNTKLGNVTNYITAGTNITITGAGTLASPYSIAAAGSSGVADGDKGDITVTASGATWNIDAGAVGNPEIAGGVDAAKIADGSVSNAEYQFINTLTSNAQTQINGKQATITTGTTLQYFRGDLSLATFPTALSSFTNDPGYITNITGKINAGTNVTITGAGTTASPYVVNASGGGATLSGTANRITIAADVVDIASTYVGQTSITTLGTIGDGTWNATPIANSKGGMPTGGTAGQMLYKSSSTDYAATWGPAPSFSVTPGDGILIDGENNISVDDDYIIALVGSGVSDGDKTDITISSSGTVYTIDNSTVTNAKMANMATLTLKGNNTGGGSAPLDLTVAQVNAILPVFTSSLNGLVPLSGGGTTNFLRADGSWAATPGIASVTTIGAVPNANAATISGGVLNLQPSSYSFGGVNTKENHIIFDNKTPYIPEGLKRQQSGLPSVVDAPFDITGATVYNAWPSIIKDRRGRLHIYYISSATGHVGNDHELKQAISGDGGATWTTSTITIPQDQCYEVHALLLSNGKIGLGINCDDAGADNTDYYMESSNDGESWSTPVVVFAKGTATFGPQTTSLVEDRGVLFLTTQIKYPGDANTTARVKRSLDWGRTWGTEISVANASGTNYNESKIVRWKNQLVAFVRDETNVQLKRTYSTDGGATWSSLTNVTPPDYEVSEPDAIVVGDVVHLHYRSYTGGTGELHRAISTDGGYTWDEDEVVDNTTGGGAMQYASTIYENGLLLTAYGLDIGSGGADAKIRMVTYAWGWAVGLSGAPSSGGGGSSDWSISGSTIYPTSASKIGNCSTCAVADLDIRTASSATQYLLGGSGSSDYSLQLFGQGDGAGEYGATWRLSNAMSAFSLNAGTLLYENQGHDIVFSREYNNIGVSYFVNDLKIIGSTGELYAYSLDDSSGVQRIVTVTDGVLGYTTGGGGGGGEDLAATLAIGSTVNSGQFINWAASSGSARNMAILNSNSGADNFAMLDVVPTSGTNVGALLRVIPNGTGYNTDFKAGIDIHNVGGSNYEMLSLSAIGSTNGYEISSNAGGSGSVRPIRIKTGGTDRMVFGASGGITINAGSNTLALPTTRPGTNGYVPSFQTDGTFGGWVSASGGGGGEDLAATLTLGNTVNSGQYINWAASSGSARNGAILNPNSGADNFAEIDLVPTAGTNAAILLALKPNGTGYSSSFKSGIELYNVAGSNFEVFSMYATGSTGYTFASSAGGSGTARSIRIQTAGSDRMVFDASGGITINNGSNTVVLPSARPGGNGYSLIGNTDGSTSWSNISGGGGFTDPLTTNGDIIARVSGTTTRLAAGTAGYVLTSNGASSNISWQPIPGANQDATFAVLLATTTDATETTMTGSMPIANGESGMLEITVYNINSTNTDSWSWKFIVKYHGTSATVTQIHSTDIVAAKGSLLGTALEPCDVTVQYNGSGDIFMTVFGISGVSLNWRAEIKKYVVIWSA